MSVIPFHTDVAALAVFDPEVLQHRVRDAKTWWRARPLEQVAEISSGRCAVVPIGREGTYRVRLAPEGPTATEEERTVGVVRGLGLTVASGEVFVGDADRLPGAGFGERISHIPDTGAVLSVPAGDYAVDVHVLAWRDDDACYDDDGEVRDDAPADFVVALRPRDVPTQVDPLPDLLDLLPKVEAKGRAKVGFVANRRRSSTPEPTRSRRRSGFSGDAADPIPRAPVAVPAEVAPYDPTRVRAAFRDVLYGRALHPPERLGLAAVSAVPLDRSLQRHDIPADILCAKVTRVREQLRTLEQKVNGSETLDTFDKVDLQTAVTVVYQSLDDLLDSLADLAPGS